ncbi:MAG: hypothetical protein IPJ19_06830 [Planctomycetes bacterium]|nr:hypothetical protein [Planctomycetota bacterium]
MSSRWVPLFEGSMPEILVLQSSCEAAGIPTFVPDLNLAYLDTSARGGNIFFFKLLVPEDRLEDARELVPESKRSSIPPLEREPTEIAQLGSRVRTCAMLIITAPLAVLFGLQYRRELFYSPNLPPGHFWTVRAFWFSVALSVCVPLAWVLDSVYPGLWKGLRP